MAHLVKLLMSGALVAFIALNFDVPAALTQLAAVDPAPAAAALALFLAFHGLGAVKLRVVMPHRSTAILFGFVLVGQAYALLLPGQLAGEAMKAYRLARGAGADVGRVVSAVAFDKLTAMAALFLLALLGLSLGNEPDGSGLIIAAVVGLTVIAGLAWSLSATWTHRLSSTLLSATGEGGGRRAWLAGHLRGFLIAWRDHAAQPRVVAASLGWGVATQCVQALASLVLGWGFGIDLGFGSWCVVIGALTVVLLAPVTIGGVGLREASLIGLLGLFGVERETALALALAILAIQIIIAALGLAVDVLVLRQT